MIALFFSPAFSQDIEHYQSPAFQYLASFSTGPAWVSGATAQTRFITPEIEKTYTQALTHSSLVTGEFFFGMQYPVYKTWESQSGLALVATNQANISGEVWDLADANFNNYNYHYTVQHTHLAVKEKLLANTQWIITPWISGSLGIAWNQSSHFYNTPTIPEAVASPNFSNHTQAAFSYTLGAGVQKVLASHWQIGLGYEFEQWGNSHLGTADEQTIGHGPSANHLYTNGLLFNLMYIA